MIFQNYRKCVKCGMVGGYFITRKHTLKSGKRIVYIGSTCRQCANEESKIRNIRYYSNPEFREKRLAEIKEYRHRHKRKVSRMNHLYYLKNKEKLLSRNKLRYIPKSKNRWNRGSHHRVPSINHPLRNFDFRNLKTIMEAS